MTEQVQNGFEIYYPAQAAMPLSWINSDPRMAENEKKAPPRLTWWLTAVADIGNDEVEKRCLLKRQDNREKLFSFLSSMSLFSQFL